MTQLARTESGKKSGPAGEARDLCFGVHEDRRLLPSMSTKAEHHISELQRQAQAAANSSDHRDRHEMLSLLLLTARILCASTGHYPHTPRSLCRTPLPGSQDPGTTSLGEHTVHLRQLQRHTSLYCSPCIPIITTIRRPPPGLSEQEPPHQLLL